MHATTNVEAVTRPDVHLVVKDFVARVLGSAALGERWLPHWWEYHREASSIIAVAGLVAVVLLARPWRARPGQLLVAGGAMAIAVGVFAFSLWFRGAGAVELFRPGVSVPGGSRLRLSAAAVRPERVDGARRRVGPSVAQDPVRRAGRRDQRLGSISIAAPRSHGPAWSTEIERARAEAGPTRPVGRLSRVGDRHHPDHALCRVARDRPVRPVRLSSRPVPGSVGPLAPTTARRPSPGARAARSPSSWWRRRARSSGGWSGRSHSCAPRRPSPGSPGSAAPPGGSSRTPSAPRSTPRRGRPPPPPA